ADVATVRPGYGPFRKGSLIRISRHDLDVGERRYDAKKGNNDKKRNAAIKQTHFWHRVIGLRQDQLEISASIKGSLESRRRRIKLDANGLYFVCSNSSNSTHRKSYCSERWNTGQIILSA